MLALIFAEHFTGGGGELGQGGFKSDHVQWFEWELKIHHLLYNLRRSSRPLTRMIFHKCIITTKYIKVATLQSYIFGFNCWFYVYKVETWSSSRYKRITFDTEHIVFLSTVIILKLEPSRRTLTWTVDVLWSCGSWRRTSRPVSPDCGNTLGQSQIYVERTPAGPGEAGSGNLTAAPGIWTAPPTGYGSLQEEKWTGCFKAILRIKYVNPLQYEGMS